MAEVTLAVWERPPPVRVGRLGQFRDVRFAATPDAVALLLAEALAGPPARWHEELVTDVAALAALFARTMGIARVEVRLDRVTGDGCWQFHADYVSCG